MAINLKEIFDYDSDQIKLEKVNYNFDQLIANGGGPQGPAGQNGPSGIGGTVGAQGVAGPMGAQGDQGPTGSDGGEYWTQIAGNPSGLLSDTLVPTHDVSQSQESPNIVIGYKSSDPEYNLGEEYSKLVVHRHSNFESNIRLKTAGVPNAFDFILSADAGTSAMTMRFNGGTPNLLSQYADRIKFLSPDSLTQYAEFDSTNLTVNVDADFQNTVVNGTMRISSGSPDTDKVAVASDLQGTIEFKSINELGGTVPVGTIISILPSIFADNTKFINQELGITLADDDNDLLPIRVGSGVGDYEGWYICNGKTWKNDTGFTFNTPDLNSFSYSIDDNANSTSQNSQGAVSVTNNDIQIIGGSDIDLTAANVYTSTYNVTSSIDSSSVDIQDGTGTLNVKIKKLPQIIYIGEADLYWEDAGSGQAPIVTNIHRFDNQGNIQQFSEQDNQGEISIVLCELLAPTGQKWTSIPTFGDPNGTTPPNISSTPSPSINTVNNQILDVYVYQLADGTTNTFTYSSSGHTAPNSATYTISANNGVTVDSTNPITINGDNQSTENLGFITFKAPQNYEFTSVNDISAPAGYTITSSSFGGGGTDNTKIIAAVSVDSFAPGSFNVNFTANLQLDLSNTTVTVSSVNVTGSSKPFSTSVQWSGTNFNSSTMDYKVEYFIGSDNSTTPTQWVDTLATTDNTSFSLSSYTSQNLDTGEWLWAKITIIDTANPSNEGASDFAVSINSAGGPL